MRGFRKRYESQIKEASENKRSPKKVIINKLRGRPCLLCSKIDPLVQKYLKLTRYKGGIVNTTVAITTARALVKRFPLLEKDIVIGKPWAQSIFLHMGFVRRRKTTGKVLIPTRAQKEAELKFLHQIVGHVENNQIPPSLIINFDQTPSKYVQVSSMTMERRGTTNVPVSGVDDKRSITATFSIALDKQFLPMQLIYNGKTNQSLPKVNFPQEFSVSVNEKHYSNEKESLKFLEDVILPYIQNERQELGSESQKALLIYDVFRGQTIDRFLVALKENNIIASKVPPNMTHLYQPLDLTVNKSAKDFMKQKFGEWFFRQINIGLENGQELDDIEIDYR